MFAPVWAGEDLFAPSSARRRSPDALGPLGQEGSLDVEFFQQPLFDEVFLQSMQTLFVDDTMNWDTNPTGL